MLKPNIKSKVVAPWDKFYEKTLKKTALISFECQL
jgi:hypothetical protein